jgi:hypothetical protein
MGLTFDLGQAEVVRLGNGTLLLPESHRPVLGSPGRNVCRWIMADYGIMMEYGGIWWIRVRVILEWDGEAQVFD